MRKIRIKIRKPKAPAPFQPNKQYKRDKRRLA